MAERVAISNLARHSAVALIAMALLSVTRAEAEPKHGLSMFGELKYAPDFTHFDYANPDAPKGGRMALIGSGGVISFDSFNNFIRKGDAAQGLEFLHDTLMVRAADEPDAAYGLIAKSADVAADGMSVTFKLRPEANFSDGSPVTADDVVNSFAMLKDKGHPRYSIALRDVEKAEALDAETVRYSFTGMLTRDLPLIIADLPVLSKAYYANQPFDETSLKAPLGSGPYSIADHKAGSFVAYKRRDDYWAKDLAVNRGRFNFDEIRFEYFRDRTIGLENLKAGAFDFREEFTSGDWATAYNIAAVKDGRLIRDILPDGSPSGAQGFFVNTRRDQFKDVHVREALGLAFDFEWSNKKLFYGLYARTQSFFENSDMKAEGVPSPAERALLEPYRDRLSAAVFEAPFTPPVTDGSGNNRDNLKKAREILAAAGWAVRQESVEDPSCGVFCKIMTSIGLKSKPLRTIARNQKGQSLDIEVLLHEEGFVRIVEPYVSNLKAIGINASIRIVDPAQYESRMKSFDFDMAVQRYSMPQTPGVQLRGYWGSDAAAVEGSFNLSGIKDPVIDALVDKVITAKSRVELVTAARAIDRVLRAGHYWVPHWYKASHTIAYWNKFSAPAIRPKYDPGVLDTWWYDTAKAAVLASGKTQAVIPANDQSSQPTQGAAQP
jgi:microcin C transport system substrate-binding protein